MATCSSSAARVRDRSASSRASRSRPSSSSTRRVAFVRRDVFDSAAGPRAVYAIDVDGDGDVDPLSATNTDDTIAWYENDGSQSFTERVITNTADYRHAPVVSRAA